MRYGPNMPVSVDVLNIFFANNFNDHVDERSQFGLSPATIFSVRKWKREHVESLCTETTMPDFLFTCLVHCLEPSVLWTKKWWQRIKTRATILRLWCPQLLFMILSISLTHFSSSTFAFPNLFSSDYVQLNTFAGQIMFIKFPYWLSKIGLSCFAPAYSGYFNGWLYTMGGNPHI